MIESMGSAHQRIGRRDVAIAVVMSLFGVLLMSSTSFEEGAEASPLAIPVFGLVTVPLLWRRVAPLPATGAALAGLVVHDLTFGAELIRCGVVLPVSFLFAFTAGAELEGRESRAGLALALGLIAAEAVTFFGPIALPFAGVAVAIWWTGRIVRSRGRMAAELELRTAELREARDERARLEVSTDRARIAGELDELLQRRLGELARLAGAGARSGDDAGATATLSEIEREGRRTLEQMRSVVGVLRHDVSPAPTAPQPTLTHLEALLVHAKGAGARLTVEGSPRVLPASVELSAYRIVEQLLAALEDAPDVEVRVRFADDALELAVSGPARRRAKAAIERARERARLERGTLEATVRGGHANAVASLPTLAVA